MTEIHLNDAQKAFVEAQVRAGTYKDADEAVAAGLEPLREEQEVLKQLIQKGIDDVEAGRVHHYASGEELLIDIKRMTAERMQKKGIGH